MLFRSNDTATTEIYTVTNTLSLQDALPISTLVNADRIAEMRSFENGDAVIILRDGTQLRMSRARRDSIERLTGRL